MPGVTLFCGVDVGASATKVCLVDAEHRLLGRAVRPSGVDYAAAASGCLEEALGEAGAALAEYVLHARPRIKDRRVFLSHLPPVRAFSGSSTVSRIVLVRLQRGGVAVQRGGAHLLRHSLATRLVAQRRPIKEVADLLGHRNIDTTSIYIKVSLPQLADLALPFPGGAS